MTGKHRSPASTASRVDTSPQRVSSDTLLGAARALIIVHNGREYRLTQTQNGKLILTA